MGQQHTFAQGETIGFDRTAPLEFCNKTSCGSSVGENARSSCWDLMAQHEVL